MKHENDFVNEEIVRYKIDGKQFGYKPTTAEDENRWMPLYLVDVEEIDKETQKTVNVRKADDYLINKCKMQNLVEVPWGSDLLYKLLTGNVPKEKEDLGTKYDWANLNLDQRWKILGKLKPKLFSSIMVKANKIDGIGCKDNGDALKK